MKRFTVLFVALIIALTFVTGAFAEELVTCGICKSTFTSDAALREHMREFHSAGSLQCPYCQNVFADEDSYNDHIAICSDQMRAGAYDTSFSSIIDRMMSMYETNASWFDSIEDVFIRLVDLFENICFMIAAAAMS